MTVTLAYFCQETELKQEKSQISIAKETASTQLGET